MLFIKGLGLMAQVGPRLKSVLGQRLILSVEKAQQPNLGPLGFGPRVGPMVSPSPLDWCRDLVMSWWCHVVGPHDVIDDVMMMSSMMSSMMSWWCHVVGPHDVMDDVMMMSLMMSWWCHGDVMHDVMMMSWWGGKSLHLILSLVTWLISNSN